MSDRYAAEIDGFALDCETLEDGFEKAVAQREYPYRDGAELEDMGERARTIRIRCYWIEARYGNHYNFLEHLKSRELLELSHPKYGLIHGIIQSVMVRHDDRAETAEVDLTFIQDLLSQEEPIINLDVMAETEEFFASGQKELMNSFSDQARLALGSQAGTVLSKQLQSGLGIADQFTQLSMPARAWLTPSGRRAHTSAA